MAGQLAGGKAVQVGADVSRAQLLRTIKSLYAVGAETFDELLKARGESMDDLLTDKELISDINANDPEASVVKFVNQIIREAIAERATDIHVEPLENDLRIRYRIDGILHEAAVPPQLRVLQSAIISRLKVMARMDIAEKRLPQDGRINLAAGTHEHRRARVHDPDRQRREHFSSASAQRPGPGIASGSSGWTSTRNRPNSSRRCWPSPTAS